MNYLLRLEGDWDGGCIDFYCGTICDMRHRIPAMGSEKFFSEENLAKDKPTQGSVECLNELAEVYELVYIGARRIFIQMLHINGCLMPVSRRERYIWEAASRSGWILSKN